MPKVKVTEKGTELPLRNLRGQDYLEVKYRLVWFREVYPTGSIQTRVEETGDTACALATIAVPVEGHGYTILATGHKKETKQDFPDNYEKAETGAIGRALAAAGFGTQFEPEFDEGERIVDAPAETKTRTKSVARSKQPETSKPVSQSNTGDADSQAAKEFGSGAVAGTNPELRVVASGSIPPASSQEDEVTYFRNCIEAAAQEVVSVKKLKTVAELKQELQNKYNVSSKNDLNVQQAEEFLNYLKAIGA